MLLAITAHLQLKRFLVMLDISAPPALQNKLFVRLVFTHQQLLSLLVTNVLLVTIAALELTQQQHTTLKQARQQN